MKYRTEINRLERQHQMQICPLSDETEQDARAVMNAYIRRKSSSDPGILAEIRAGGLALENRRLLGMQGVIVFADGEPVSMAAGIPVSETVFDGFLLKIGTVLPGLGLYTCRAMAQAMAPHYPLLNGEEDMGHSGIRIFKQKMQPCGMVQMWEAVYEAD